MSVLIHEGRRVPCTCHRDRTEDGRVGVAEETRAKNPANRTASEVAQRSVVGRVAQRKAPCGRDSTRRRALGRTVRLLQGAPQGQSHAVVRSRIIGPVGSLKTHHDFGAEGSRATHDDGNGVQSRIAGRILRSAVHPERKQRGRSALNGHPRPTYVRKARLYGLRTPEL